MKTDLDNVDVEYVIDGKPVTKKEWDEFWGYHPTFSECVIGVISLYTSRLRYLCRGFLKR